jgi:hypothetical protein
MVNENYGRPRVRMSSSADDDGYQLRPNPKGRHLREGDTVVLNYADEIARDECPIGVIDEIDAHMAFVEWERGEMESAWWELKWLRKVKV